MKYTAPFREMFLREQTGRSILYSKTCPTWTLPYASWWQNHYNYKALRDAVVCLCSKGAKFLRVELFVVFFCISAITQCRSKFSPGFQRNFQKFSYAQVDRLGAPYDLNSLMHLYRMSWSKNGKNTIEARAGAGIPLGTKQGLSDIDRQQLNQLYRCGGYKGRPCW